MRYFLILTLIFLLPILAGAQKKDSLYLVGSLNVSDHANYSYKIVLGETAGQWQGYSLLDENGPNETKTSLIATIIAPKKSIAFTERKLINTQSKEKNFCYIAGVVKLQAKKKELKGFFAGQDEQKKLCYSGTVSFRSSLNIEALLHTKTKDTTTKTTIITSHNSERMVSKTKELILEVWDGGIEDRDSISILLNQQIIEPAILISKEKKRIPIVLSEGENLIQIKALNDGMEVPNSSRILLINGDKNYPLVSFLRKGEIASIIINYKR